MLLLSQVSSQILLERELDFPPSAINQAVVNEDGSFELVSWGQITQFTENAEASNEIFLPRELRSDGGNMFVYEGQLYHMDLLFTSKLSSIDVDGQVSSQIDIHEVDGQFFFPTKIEPFDLSTYVVSIGSSRTKELMLYNTTEGPIFRVEIDWYEIKNDQLYYTINDDVFVYSKTGELIHRGQIVNGNETEKWVDELGNIHYSSVFTDLNNPITVLDFKNDRKYKYERGYFLKDEDGPDLTPIPVNEVLWTSQVNIEKQYVVVETDNHLNLVYGYPSSFVSKVFLTEEFTDASLAIVKEIPNSDEVLVFIGKENNTSTTTVYKVKTGLESFDGRVPIFSGGLSGTGHFFCENIPDFIYSVEGDTNSRIPAGGFFTESNGTGGLEDFFGNTLARREGIFLKRERYYTDAENNGAGDMIEDSTVLSLKFDNPISPEQLGFTLRGVHDNQITISAKDENGNEISREDINTWLLSIYKTEPDNRENPVWDTNTNTVVGAFASSPEKQLVYGPFFQGASRGAVAFIIKNKISELIFSMQNTHIDLNDSEITVLLVTNCSLNSTAEETEENEQENVPGPEDNNTELFDTYTWLNDEYSNCENVTITEYDLGPFAFIYGSDGRLFFEDGTFYCQDSETRDCRALYNLMEITREETCGEETDENSLVFAMSDASGNIGDQVCVDYILPAIDSIEFLQIPIQYDPNILELSDCQSFDIFEGFNCGNNVTLTSEGEIRVLWFHPNAQSNTTLEDDVLFRLCFDIIDDSVSETQIELRPTNGFDFAIGNPGDVISNPIFNFGTISINDDSSSESEGLPIDELPWLSGIIDDFDCTSLTVTEYQQSIFSFYYLEDNTQSVLFFEDGTRYCTSSATYDCLAAYGFETTQFNNQFSCGEDNSSPPINEVDGLPDDLVEAYPFIVDVVSCESNEQITEYQSGIFNFIYIEPQGSLYFQDGTFYCMDSERQDCRSLYDLTVISNDWRCGENNLAEVNTEKNIKPKSYKGLSIFPNPTYQDINIHSSTIIEEVYLFDSSGRMVQQIINPNASDLNLDLKDEINGIYFLKINTAISREVHRIVKTD